MTRLCIDCRYCVFHSGHGQDAICTHPAVQPAPIKNLVTGGITQTRRWCLSERAHGLCGENGKLGSRRAASRWVRTHRSIRSRARTPASSDTARRVRRPGKARTILRRLSPGHPSLIAALVLMVHQLPGVEFIGSARYGLPHAAKKTTPPIGISASRPPGLMPRRCLDTRLNRLGRPLATR
jgi:hypothetical protein